MTTDATVPQARITAFFQLNAAGRHGETQSIGNTAAVFSPNISANLQTGLESIGAWLATTANVLPERASIEVALDLSAHGGANRRYRFTRFTHRTGQGRRARESAALLVEDVGPVAAAPAAIAQVPRSLTVGAATFPLRGTWSASDFSVLQQALNLLPAAALVAIGGVTFRRNRGPAPGTERGHYDPDTHTVSLYSNSFPVTSTRFGGSSPGVRIILHEIAHAIDLLPLRQAWATFDQAGQSRPAERALLRARSASGTRWVLDSAGTYVQQIPPGDRNPAFRAAVRRDGVRAEPAPRRGQAARVTPEGTTATLQGGVTTYSDTDYQELYAESFALYVTDRARLQALRPATHAYFLRLFP